MKKGFPFKLFIIAGEVSGDIHGSKLMASLNALVPDLRFSGIGGDLMIKDGLRILYHMRQMAFLGIGEVIRHLPFIYKVMRSVKSYLRKEKPDAMILIDYPGFNLKVAAYAYSLGIPVIYYISPQLWAWGTRRVRKIRRYVSKMIVVFPFEVDFYAQHEISAVYVGHPLVDRFGTSVRIKSRQNKERILGLLPGSRIHELEQLLPDMVSTARLLRERGEIDKALIARVDHISIDVYQGFIKGLDYIDIRINDGQAYYEQLDAALVSSGTATLETGYFRVPMVVVYRVSNLTWVLGRMLVKLDSIGLVNIVAGEEICPELLQRNFTPRNAAKILSGLMEVKKNDMIREKLDVIRKKLGLPGASHRAAEEIIKSLSHGVKKD